MFLSHQGWKVCNIPLVKGVPLPQEVLNADQDKIVGLTIQADVLQHIRKARLERLAAEPNSSKSESYASIESVSDEIEYANSIFRMHKRWPIFDVSGKALEETAAEIIRIMSSRKKLAQRKIQRAKE